jgi:hypothetical protein
MLFEKMLKEKFSGDVSCLVEKIVACSFAEFFG